MLLPLLLPLLLAVGGAAAAESAEAACPARCRCAEGPETELQCAAGARGEVSLRGRRGQYVNVECDDMSANTTLPCDALPHFDFGANRSLASLGLRFCPTSALPCVLPALLASGSRTVTLNAMLGGVRVTAALLEGLQDLQMLDIRGEDVEVDEVSIEEGALSALPALADLSINSARLVNFSASWLAGAAPTLRRLELSNAGATRLPRAAFRHARALRQLVLWGNALQEVDDGTFEGLTELRELDLASNALRALPPSALAHAPHLRVLRLYHNQLDVLGPLGALSELEELQLFDNGAALALAPRALAALASLARVVLARCGIESLPDDAFAGAAALRSLDLSGNRLAGVRPAALRPLTALTSLDLSGNRLLALDAAALQPLRALQRLALDGNRLAALPPGLLDGLSTLTSFSARHNALRALPPAALRGAANLEELLLGYNQLALHEPAPQGSYQNLSPAPSPLNALLRLRRVDLSHNLLRAAPPDVAYVLLRLELLDLSHNRIVELGAGDLDFLAPNVTVDLSHNNITTVFLQRDVLPRVDLDSITGRILLEDNPFLCDCELYTLARRLRGYRPFTTEPAFVAGDARCAAPPTLSGKLLSSLALADFACDLSGEECVSDCSCVSRPDAQAVELTCSSTPSRAPSAPYPVLHYDLRLLNSSSTAGLTFHVRALNLSGLGLSSLPDYDFSKVEILDLTGNSFKEIPLDLFAMNLSLHLRGNPLSCDCWSSDDVTAWQDNRERFNDYATMTCADGTLVSLINAPQLCYTLRAALLGGALALLGLLVALTAALLYCFPLEVRAVLYKYGLCGWWVNEEVLDKDKPFDAFVSFSHADTHFVLEQLIPGLEPQFRVCVHLRDWVAGEWIPAQIARSVEESRRTIIVLSNDFLTSAWGRLEFRAAHMAAASEARSRVVLVLLEDVSDHPSLDAELKAYLRTHTYLRWGETDFWAKLRYMLPHRRDERRHRVGGARLLRKALSWRAGGPEPPDVSPKGGLDVKLTADGKLVNMNAIKAPPAKPSGDKCALYTITAS